jgi:hypothetical protein
MENLTLSKNELPENSFYKLTAEEQESLDFYENATFYDLAYELYELQRRHKIKYAYLKCIYNSFISRFDMYEDDEFYPPQSVAIKKVWEEFQSDLSNFGHTKEVYEQYLSGVSLRGINWKSVKTLISNEFVIDLFADLIELFENDYYSEISLNKIIDNIYVLVQQLKWKESKFRNKLQNGEIELNIAFIKRFILKKDACFDKFYLPWMRPYLDKALFLLSEHNKRMEEFFEESDFENEEDDKEYSDWLDSIEPDFDWDEISDPDLRDSLSDLY